MFFDTHVHFDDFVKDGLLDDVLAATEHAGVVRMVAVGGSMEANTTAQQLAADFPSTIFAAAGYDRYLAGEELDFSLLKELVSNPRTVAVGECGLDYFYEPEKAKAQQKLFADCLELAASAGKPVIVHTRDADDDTLSMLSDYAKCRTGDRPGVIHCFTRDRRMARAFLDIGFYLSFSGIVTFANADMLRDVAAFVPDDRLLVETDSPYLAPVPHRGKRCEPSFVVETVKRLAVVRSSTVESLAKITAENAAHLFGI